MLPEYNFTSVASEKSASSLTLPNITGFNWTKNTNFKTRQGDANKSPQLERAC
jgi:hypothetical protein